MRAEGSNDGITPQNEKRDQKMMVLMSFSLHLVPTYGSLLHKVAFPIACTSISLPPYTCTSYRVTVPKVCVFRGSVAGGRELVLSVRVKRIMT